MDLVNVTKKTVLITGGSSGIGLELARLFARDGYRLVLVSKPADELEQAKKNLEKEVPGAEIITRAQDLAVPGAAREVHAFTRELALSVDVLVNNAGFGTFGFINDIDEEKELSMIQLHVGTLYHLSRLYLREMVDRNHGRVINLSSVSAFQPNPMLATYGATKSFVLDWSRAVDYEMRERGLDVRVLAVCPPPVKATRFQQAAGMDRSNTFDTWMVQTADIVARDAYRAMQRGKEVVIPGRGMELLQKFVGRLPSSLKIWLSRQHLLEKK